MKYKNTYLVQILKLLLILTLALYRKSLKSVQIEKSYRTIKITNHQHIHMYVNL